MKSTINLYSPHWSRRALRCFLAILFAGSCLANEIFVVGNTAIPADSSFSFLESLTGHGMGDINEETVLTIEGRVTLGQEAGDQLACAELRIKTGGPEGSSAALYVRRILLAVSGDVEINSVIKGPDAALALEKGARFSWGGTMNVVGSTARLGVFGDGTAEGGSLDIEDAKLLVNIQTQEFFERFFSEPRPALISLEREFSVSADATVQLTLDKEAADSELPEGEFVIVRSAKTSGEVPKLEITGVSPEQAARASLKLDEDGLSLIVTPTP
jgi:hypothetical protein